MNRTKRLCAFFITAVILCSLLPFCAGFGAEVPSGAPSVESFNGKKIGTVTGTAFDTLLAENYPDSEITYFNALSDMIMALKSGKIDAFIHDRPVAEEALKSESSLAVANGVVAPDDYGLVFPKTDKGDTMRRQFNEYLRKIKDSGELDEIMKRRFGGSDDSLADVPTRGDNGVLTVATTATLPPFTFMTDKGITGYVFDLLAGFCKEFGYGAKIVDIEPTGFVARIVSGKYDMYVSSVSITEERKESVLFTDPVYEGGVVLVYQKAGGSGAGAISDYAHKRIGIKEGSIFDRMADEILPEATKYEYKSNPDLVLALTQGKIDCFMANSASADSIMSETQGIFVVGGEKMPTEEYGFCFPKSDDEKNVRLLGEFNEFVKKITADGTLDEIYKIWTGADEAKKVIDLDGASGENGEVMLAINSGQVPFVYVKDGKYVGYDIDIAARFCNEYGYSLKFSDMDFGAIVPAVNTGKCSFGMSLSETAERMESVSFSETTFEGGVVLLAYSGDENKSPGFFKSVADSFEKTFIREERWKLILSGVGTTMLISVLAALSGTVLGFGICMLRRSRHKPVAVIAQVYIRLLQGTPIVVFLMIMFYVVFGKSTINPMWVAVMGFAMNFAAYSAEIMRTGIDAVDNGQIEAAKAIGFTPAQTFLQVVMPQAARHFLPVYKGELISLVKSTSIVGYIAVQDLTKVSDIIRSRTYEAFFPLIATAVIYFILAWLLTIIINLIMKKVEPDYKKRTVKGVTMK